jgi:hypothetical protein
MANNAFNFKGLYDKVVGLIKNSYIVSNYTPNENDYVAIYKNVPTSGEIGDNVIAVKNYVPVTDIGTGGGGGGGSMTSFDVTGEGGITLSLDGTTYSDGPLTVENADNIRISSTAVPSGLNWTGPFSNATDYSTNDVISWIDPDTDIYYTYWATTAIDSGGGDPDLNSDWVLLGTQGPAGPTGPIGTNAVATYGFADVSQGGGTITTAIITTGTPGDGTNSTGKIIRVNNTSTLSELVIEIGANYGAGWPANSQITFVNISAEDRAPVKIVGATTPNAVTLNSADGAQYLRTRYSSCSLVREGVSGLTGNTYWMFGDLTNIA